MSSERFEEWVLELNRKFGSIKRKIVLITDNCTAHSHVENLELIELILLPPNTTSHTYPMDQYYSLAIRKLISALEKKELIPTMFILSAMIMLRKNAASIKTFTSCFKKAGTSEK